MKIIKAEWVKKTRSSDQLSDLMKVTVLMTKDEYERLGGLNSPD